MKRTFPILISLLVSMFTQSAFAQTAQIEEPKDTTVTKNYLDSLKLVIEKYSQDSSSSKLNPYMYKLTTTPTYYNGPLRQVLGLDSVASPEQMAMYKALLNAYMENPGAFRVTENSLNSVKTTVEKTEPAPSIKVEKLVEVEKPVVDAQVIELQASKPNFWKYNANIFYQFSQSHISSNWYNGGESNNTMLGGFTLEAKFDDQKRIEWENKAEIKVGFITSKGDSLHKYKTNNDLFRLTSKFGYKAIKNWYYTAVGEINNQFFPGYKTNDPVKHSAFMAPLKFNGSIGMDWKLKKDKKFDFSLALLPFSYNLIWVLGNEVNPTSFGIDAGKKSISTFGSKVQLDHTLFFTSQISWKSHFYLFSSYHKTDSLWENTFDFAVNKYLSAKMYLNLRFDDTAKKSANHGYLQIQELLSFGVSYSL